MDSDPLIPVSNPLMRFVDHRGRPISRSATGGWRSAVFIIGVEVAERTAFCAVQQNLVMYLTGNLGEPTASAAAGVNAWFGTSQLMPLLGAVVADSYLGRYRSIIIASILYVLGLGLLTLSAVLSSLSRQVQVALFYFSLYLVAFAQAGHKPCVQAFGADQFDENDPQESIGRSSFFNWWYFGLTAGLMISLVVLSYVQDNIGWGLGFGIPCIIMAIALVVFLMGTKSYRYYILEDESPFARIGRALAALMRTRNVDFQKSYQSSLILEGEGEGEGETPLLSAANQSKRMEESDPLSATQLEEAKGVLRLLPIWATCLVYAVVFSQSSTFFTKQGSTLDRKIWSSFQIPPAALQSIICVAVLAFIPIYDRILIPIARKFSNRPSGISSIQRIGTGIFVSMLSMVVSALVEIKRLKTARYFGLVDKPEIAIPMSLWWLIPQYILFGIAEVFAMVGMQEFFYDQVPESLRSLGLALYLSVFGIGSFISSFLVTVIDRITSSSGDGWFSNNLNRAHLDYFYWLLAGLSAAGLAIYILCAHAYVYKSKGQGAL